MKYLLSLLVFLLSLNFIAHAQMACTTTTTDSTLCFGESTTLTTNTTVSPSSICSGAALPTNLQTGLVGYWPFCGNANDASGNGNNGTVNGATLTTDRFGNTNSAYSFDGNDWISATRAHQAVFTASVWVQSMNGNCNKPILDANNKSWELNSDCANGQLNFVVWNGGTYTYHSSNVALGLNTWYHVVAVYSSSQIKIYVNGSLITTQVTTAVPAISGVLNMGASLSGTSQYFTGKLDDVGLWSRALTLAEIQQLYTQGQTTYSWSPGNATTQSITVSPTTTTTYTCTTSVNGASCSDTIVVTVNPLPSINAGSDKTICAGDSVAITASGSPLIAWNNGILNGVYFSPTATTTYTVTGTGANGCINTDQAVVFVNSLPNVNAGTDTAVCNGSFFTLSGSGAVSYTWSNSVTNNVPFIPLLSNTFTVIGTDTNGCKDSDQIQVTVNVLPPVNAGNNVAICIGDSIQLNGSGAVSYVWDNGVVNNTAFYPTSTLTYHVIGTNANGCSNSDSVIVTVNSLPTVFAGNDTLLCDQSTYTLSGSGATTYTWNNGVTNGVPFTVTANTTYTVQGIDGNGCQNTDQVTLTTKPLPTVDAGSDKAVCFGDSLFFTATGTGVSFSWSNGLINGDYFIPTSTMTLTVTTTAANGCSQTDQVLATVNPLPTVDAGPDRIICKGQAIALNAVSNGSIVWGGGVVNNLPFNPSTTATYGVTATSAAGCVNTDDVTVSVGDYPNANFYTLTPTQYSPNSTFDFVNLSTGAATYDWDFGDLIGTSSATNPSYTYQPLVTATYFVTLVVSSTLGCKDSLTSVVQLINNSPGLDVIIPTGFSPNNDSDNDDWTIYGIENYPNSKISVFNRWGLKVFEGSELFPTWNGIYGGVMLPTADYYYVVELSDGRKFNGVVTLKQ
jgi:gliding motility-associated-like protein